MKKLLPLLIGLLSLVVALVFKLDVPTPVRDWVKDTTACLASLPQQAKLFRIGADERQPGVYGRGEIRPSAAEDIQVLGKVVGWTAGVRSYGENIRLHTLRIWHGLIAGLGSYEGRASIRSL